MVMPPCGTFDYMIVVPAQIADGAFECVAQSREEILTRGSHLTDDRLVGLAPLVRASDDSLTSPDYAGRPEAARIRVTLTARSRTRATVASVSFHVDKVLMRRLRHGDVIYLSRTDCGGRALSVIRDGNLVVAAGAVTSVPLGNGVSAATSWELMRAVAAPLRARDPEFEFPELPLEITVHETTTILFSGRREIRPIELHVAHGFRIDLPGDAECASIWRMGECNPVAAIVSAEWLDDARDFLLEEWFDRR